MSGTKHELAQVVNDLNGGWSAVCTCGRWGYAGAASKAKLKDKHAEHVRESR